MPSLRSFRADRPGAFALLVLCASTLLGSIVGVVYYLVVLIRSDAIDVVVPLGAGFLFGAVLGAAVGVALAIASYFLSGPTPWSRDRPS
jgi:hypothetical protein